MKTGALVIGVLLLIVGGLVAMGAISFPDSEEVLRIGDNALSVEHQKTPSSTLGYVLLGAGVLVTGFGVMRKKS